MRFEEWTTALDEESRLHFYEVFAHNLTVAIRDIWSNDSINDTEKVERIKRVNEILHRVTAKVYVLRLKTHEWTESDFGSLVREVVAQHEAVRGVVADAIGRSFQAIGLTTAPSIGLERPRSSLDAEG